MGDPENLKFTYSETKPVVIEAWMQKANIGIIERWQKRLFRLQGRAIFYFKKEKGEPPCGFIPLIDVEVNDLPSKKGRIYGFSINIKSPNTISKRAEYLLCAETKDTREQWKRAILANRSKTLVGQPLIIACSLNPTSRDIHTLLPYFVPPIFKALDEHGVKTRGIWTIEISQDTLNNMLHLLNQNYLIPTDDVHNAVGLLISYLKLLPESLIPSDSMYEFAEKITPEFVKAKIYDAPAVNRQFLKILGLHLKKVLDNSNVNGVTQYSLLPSLGQILLKAPGYSPKYNPLSPAKVKEIQDKVAQCFLANANRILDDVHLLENAPKLQVRRKARVTETVQTHGEPDLLEANRGLLVNVVRNDYNGWCTVYTSNRKAGLIHEAYLKNISPEEESELQSGPNLDSMFDIVREKMPDLMLLFESMLEEAVKIRDALEA